MSIHDKNIKNEFNGRHDLTLRDDMQELGVLMGGLALSAAAGVGAYLVTESYGAGVAAFWAPLLAGVYLYGGDVKEDEKPRYRPERSQRSLKGHHSLG